MSSAEIEYYWSGAVTIKTGVFYVDYDPNTYEENAGKVEIHSSDPEDFLIEIPIIGFGDAPVIDINTNYIKFSDTSIACEDTEEVYISNIGNLDLEVTDITLYGFLPSGSAHV